LQRDPREVEGTVAAFMEMACPMITSPRRDEDYMIILQRDALAFASLWSSQAA